VGARRLVQRGSLGEREPAGQLQGHPAAFGAQGELEGGLALGVQEAPFPQEVQRSRLQAQNFHRPGESRELHGEESPLDLGGKGLEPGLLLDGLGHAGQGSSLAQ